MIDSPEKKSLSYFPRGAQENGRRFHVGDDILDIHINIADRTFCFSSVQTRVHAIAIAHGQ